MSDGILPLIERIVEEEEVGTLFLGRGDSVRQVFFSGEEVFFVEEDMPTSRFVPSPDLFDIDKATPNVLVELHSKLVGSDRMPADMLERAGLLSGKSVVAYQHREVAEKILTAITMCRDHFHFEPGNVPESLITVDAEAVPSLPLAKLPDAVVARREEVDRVNELLPRSDEVLVLTDQGNAVRNEPRHWLYAQVASLVDGTRSLKTIVDESMYFPHRTLQILSTACRQGWLKKTMIRELASTDADGGAGDLISRIELFERNLPLAMDSLPLREKLVEMCLAADRSSGAVVHLVALGEAALERGDRNMAVGLFERACTIDEKHPALEGHLEGLYRELCTEAMNAGDLAKTREYLTWLAHQRPSEIALWLRLLETRKNDEAAMSRECQRMIDFLHQVEEPMVALEVLKRFCSSNPEFVVLRRRLVNIYIEAGRGDEAIRELTNLFERMNAEGRLEEAQELHRKIQRLTGVGTSSSMDPVPSMKKKKRLSLMPSPALLCFMAFLIAFGFYQKHAFDAYQRLESELQTALLHPTPPLGSDGYRQVTVKARELRNTIENETRSLPFALWVAPLSTVAHAAEDRARALENLLSVKLDTILERANLAQTKGQFDEAKALFEELQIRGKDTSWAEEANKRLEEITGYRVESSDLLVAANDAEAMGDIEKAFDLLTELRIRFPRSESARQIQLPIVVRSMPQGATVRQGDEVLGTTPVTVHVSPWDQLALVVEAPDGRTASLMIENPLEYSTTVEFE